MTRRQRLFWALRAAVAVGLLVLLALRIDGAAIAQAALAVDPGYLLASCVVVVLTQMASAARLKLLLQPTDLRLGTGRLIVIELIARFYGMFLPSGIGRGLARWYKVTRGTEHRATFAVVTIVERSMLLLTTAACVGIPLLATAGAVGRPVALVATPVVLGALFVALAVFLTTFTDLGKRLAGSVVVRLRERFGWAVLDRLEVAVDSLSTYRSHWRVLAAGLAATVGMQLLIVLRIGLLMGAVHVDLPWLTIVWLGALTFMLQTLPISIAGIGVRESVFAFGFVQLGLEADEGVLVGLLFFAQVLGLAAVGGVLELLERE